VLPRPEGNQRSSAQVDEQAHPGFGLLQDEEKFIRIMLHANADSRVGKLLYSMFLDRTS